MYRIWASARAVQLEEWFRSWVPDLVYSAGGGRSSVEAWFSNALEIEEVADVVKSLDAVDRGILDRVLSCLGLPAWFRHAYFKFHSHNRLRLKLATGLGQPWTRDGGIPQGCPLNMMFMKALYLLCCKYLAAQELVEPQLFSDNLKCVSRDPDLHLHAAWYTTGYVRLVEQEPASSKCVLMSTSKVVRKGMRDWILTDEGDTWTVKLDVQDLSGHLDTTFRGWSATVASRVWLVISRLVLIFVLPLGFHGRLGLFGPCIVSLLPSPVLWVNSDDRSSPLVWSAGALPKRRGLVDAMLCCVEERLFGPRIG